MKKTWFITGASRGFGRIWAEAALTRGEAWEDVSNAAQGQPLKTSIGS